MYTHGTAKRMKVVCCLCCFVEVSVEVKLGKAKTIEIKGYFREVSFP
jgi:hypothetical protein